MVPPPSLARLAPGRYVPPLRS
ncbi:hypothetical protein ACHAWF_013043 [Thalassiosira exigua]